MVDLDHFKKINDTYGHLAGDKALESVAQVLTAMSRTSDTVCRLGGEEFAIILPETTNANAIVVAERIRKKISQLDLGFTCDRQYWCRFRQSDEVVAAGTHYCRSGWGSL